MDLGLRNRVYLVTGGSHDAARNGADHWMRSGLRLAHVQAADLDQNVAAWVVVLYAVAESGINFRASSL